MRNRIHIKRGRPSAAAPDNASSVSTSGTENAKDARENETTSLEDRGDSVASGPAGDAAIDEESEAVPEWKANAGERKYRRVTSTDIDVYRNSADQTGPADKNGDDNDDDTDYVEADSENVGTDAYGGVDGVGRGRNRSGPSDLSLFPRRDTGLVRAPAEWRMLTLSPRGLVPMAQEKPVAANSPRLEETTEYFFQLYTGLERMIGDDRYVLGVTSAVRGEGKTTVALHLALAAVRSSYRRVCLVDLSMGEDDLCRRLGVAPAPGGVVTLLEGDDGDHPRLAILECRGVEQLSFLPAAGVPRKAARAVRSPRLPALLAGLREEYDLVIVDLPYVRSNNASPLSPLLDGVLMVTRAGATPRGVVLNAINQIGRERVLSVVLNRTQNFRGKKK